MKKKKYAFTFLSVLAFAIAACSWGTTDHNESGTAGDLQAEFDKLPVGDATRGEQIFAAQPCHTCHVDLSVGPTFPGDSSLAALAETRRAGFPAEIYLYESIVEPDAYLVPGFQGDIMPGDFARSLTEQELADLIAYMMTMK